MKKILLLIPALAFLATSCNVDFNDGGVPSAEPIHTHQWSGYKYDEKEHWKECHNCDEVDFKGAHNYGNWIIDEDESCTEAGHRHHECKVCGYTESEEIAPGHVWADTFTVDVEANCQHAGQKSIHCLRCDERKSVTNIPMTDHTIRSTHVENRVEPTYTQEGGYDLVGLCEVCGQEVVTRHVVLPVMTYSQGLTYEVIPDADALSVTGMGECTDQQIIIPEAHEDLPHYEELPVKRIGEGAFKDQDIVSVVIPDTVEVIEDKAFAGCEDLVEISIPDNVELGTDVFRDSINVELDYRHNLVHVDAKEATCQEEGWIEHYYCEDCHQCYADAEGEIRIYDTSIAPGHEFEAGVCIHCGLIENSVLIVDVEQVEDLGKFPLGTMEDVIGLPKTIKVTTADGLVHDLGVQWDLSEYEKAIIGEYVLTGILQASGYYFQSEELKTVITHIIITDELIGTADIVFVLDISGSMSGAITSVKNNINAFAQAIEDQGVSARWSVVTYSDEFDVPGSAVEKSQFVGSQWYTDASSCKDAVNSINLAYGGDGPEAAVDGLAFAHENLTTRRDARVFYILLTDADYKDNNNYGIADMAELTQILKKDRICVSAIAETYHYNCYQNLVEQTGGALFNISSSFAQELNTKLSDIIYGRVED